MIKSYFLKNISLLVIVTIATISSNAIGITDSLPSCITTMKRNDTLVISAEYEYKGQRWFIIGKKISQPEENYPGKMTTTKFYNENCQLVCTWTKGSFPGLNKISPDSIDKTKIIKIGEILLEKTPAVDSLPSCILKMKQKDSLLIVDKYDYKGQRWFGISPKLIENDKMFIIKFYNTDCKLVATWHGGHNQIVPDSIDKTKILNFGKVKVPEAVFKLAVKNNALSVTAYEYLGQTLYFLNEQNDIFNSSTQKEMIKIEPYYDKNGTVIIAFKRATSSSFLRAQGWQPHTVQPKNLVKKGTIWYNIQTKN